MHYYKKNIGDYAKKAGRLSMLQHGAYTLLIDACYDREDFPTKEQAIDWSWASSSDEIEAVNFVLSKFFTLENGVYKQKRIAEEIDNYQQRSKTNKRIAIKLEETKRDKKSTIRAKRKTKRERSVNESPPNHNPLNKNHKQLNNTKAPVG